MSESSAISIFASSATRAARCRVNYLAEGFRSLDSLGEVPLPFCNHPLSLNRHYFAAVVWIDCRNSSASSRAAMVSK